MVGKWSVLYKIFIMKACLYSHLWLSIEQCTWIQLFVVHYKSRRYKIVAYHDRKLPGIIWILTEPFEYMFSRWGFAKRLPGRYTINGHRWILHCIAISSRVWGCLVWQPSVRNNAPGKLEFGQYWCKRAVIVALLAKDFWSGGHCSPDRVTHAWYIMNQWLQGFCLSR
jgi:hypothetical protein